MSIVVTPADLRIEKTFIRASGLDSSPQGLKPPPPITALTGIMAVVLGVGFRGFGLEVGVWCRG